MKKQIISFNEFTNLISKICRDISVGDWKPDYIVGITRGGLFPAVMISHYFDLPCYTLNVSLRDHLTQESNSWMSEDAFNNKKILVVDDINDSGATVNWIIKDWESTCMPNSPSWEDVWNNNVRFAVVVDNLSSQSNVKMCYTGLEINKIEEDIWIEFPYEEWWKK